MKNSKSSNYIKQFVKDIIPVIFGILIALFINNWNENRKDRNYIKKFYVSLKKELNQTNKEIKDKIPHQRSVIDSLNSYMKDTKVTLLNTIIKADGIKAPTIRINYWKAISNSKIELLEYEQLATLSTIEEGKKLLDLKLKNLIDFLSSSGMNDTTKNAKLKAKFMIQDIIVTEKGIQEEIEKVLNQ